jgi:opacity protein-like surface antigen
MGATKREKKGHMRFKTAFILAVLALAAGSAWSQEPAPLDQWEGSAIVTGNHQFKATGDGETDTATNSLGIVFSARYRFRPHLSVEANGGFTTFTQYYEPVSSSQEQANIYEGSAALIYSFRSAKVRLRPFIEAGGGVEYFSPVATGSTPGGSKTVKPSAIVGIGADYRLSPHVAFRFGYRGVFYQPPSFSLATETVNTFTQMSEPYIGLVLRF